MASKLLKILILTAASLLIAFIIVWPLWKFATCASKIYTWTVLTALVIAIGVSIILRIKKHAKK